MNKDQFQGAAQDVAGKLQQTAGMAIGSPETRGHGLVREVSGKAQNLYGDARAIADDLSEQAGDVFERAQGQVRQAGDLYDRAQGEVRRGSRVVQRQVGQHPLTSVLLAGAAGFLVGLLVNGRS